jgi:hypothetical protein
MTEPTYSFVYDRTTADAAFHGIGFRELVPCQLAGIPPAAERQGCLVYQGESPLEAGTVCIGTSGPGADALQLRLVDAFERQNILIVAVYEGEPDTRPPLAGAGVGKWMTPDG